MGAALDSAADLGAALDYAADLVVAQLTVNDGWVAGLFTAVNCLSM